MRNVSANVYKFDELPLSVQTKVIDRYRDRLSDLLNDDLKEAMNLKRQGVKAGVLDIFLPVARKDKHGLWIAMK